MPSYVNGLHDLNVSLNSSPSKMEAAHAMHHYGIDHQTT